MITSTIIFTTFVTHKWQLSQFFQIQVNLTKWKICSITAKSKIISRPLKFLNVRCNNIWTRSKENYIQRWKRRKNVIAAAWNPLARFLAPAISYALAKVASQPGAGRHEVLCAANHKPWVFTSTSPLCLPRLNSCCCCRRRAKCMYSDSFSAFRAKLCGRKQAYHYPKEKSKKGMYICMGVTYTYAYNICGKFITMAQYSMTQVKSGSDLIKEEWKFSSP